MEVLTRLWEAPWFSQLVELGGLLVAATIAYGIARVWIVSTIRRLVRRTQTNWDDALVNNDVFVRLAHLAPALVVIYGLEFVSLNETLEQLVKRVAVGVMVVVAGMSVASFLNALEDIYSSKPENRQRPIRGYVQVLKIVLFVLAAVSIVSILLDKSPLIFVSGIGAMSAVLLLIFKDTILSLVASVQLTSNDMVHVGDWIEMPKYGADGDVIDVALHTVTIQNWDKTITTVPTYALIADSFKNWRGMSKAGGRRIKRSLYIDKSTIRFLEPEEIERFRSWALLREHIASKTRELDSYNADAGRDPQVRGNIRRLTNVGTLRAYILAYLKAHPKIHPGMTLMVRQLQPGPDGLPMEIYCFTNDTDWAVYEGIQADLFDHILATLPEFGLRVFQNPTGADLDRIVGERGGSDA